MNNQDGAIFGSRIILKGSDFEAQAKILPIIQNTIAS